MLSLLVLDQSYNMWADLPSRKDELTVSHTAVECCAADIDIYTLSSTLRPMAESASELLRFADHLTGPHHLYTEGLPCQERSLYTMRAASRREKMHPHPSLTLTEMRPCCETKCRHQLHYAHRRVEDILISSQSMPIAVLQNHMEYLQILSLQTSGLETTCM